MDSSDSWGIFTMSSPVLSIPFKNPIFPVTQIIWVTSLLFSLHWFSTSVDNQSSTFSYKMRVREVRSLRAPIWGQQRIQWKQPSQQPCTARLWDLLAERWITRGQEGWTGSQAWTPRRACGRSRESPKLSWEEFNKITRLLSNRGSLLASGPRKGLPARSNNTSNYCT